MKQFSILSPVLGKREDAPNIFIDKAMTPDIVNCQYWNGKVRTSYGRDPELADASGVSVATPDAQPILTYLKHQSDDGAKYLLSFTALHAYRWDSVGHAWDVMFTCATTATTYNWSAVSFNGKVVATNNVDLPQVWEGSTGTGFADLNTVLASSGASSGVTVTKAKVCTVFESHVVFGGYVLSDSTNYPNGIIISDLDDEALWDQTVAGDQSAYYVDGAGIISGLGVKGDLMHVFKTRSSRAFWYTGTATVLNSRLHNPSVGTFSQDSIGNDGNGNLYFLGSDMSFREVDIGILSQAIKESVRTVNTEADAIVNVKFTYIPEYDELWWACPTGTSTTNIKIYCFSKMGTWYERDTPVSAFGKYEYSLNYTWENQPAGTWDDWAGVWDDSTESAGWMIDICGDDAGYTYKSHGSIGDTRWSNSAMKSRLVPYGIVLSTDLGNKGSLRYFKRLLYIYGYFTSIGEGPIWVYIKQDNEASWQLAGSITTNGTEAIHIGELAVDYRARHFLIRFAGITPFEFLGCELEYLDSGLR